MRNTPEVRNGERIAILSPQNELSMCRTHTQLYEDCNTVAECMHRYLIAAVIEWHKANECTRSEFACVLVCT